MLLPSFPEVGMDTVPEALPAWLAAEVHCQGQLLKSGRKFLMEREGD